MVELLDTIDYTLSMRRGDRYLPEVNGVRYWKAKVCGHPVPNNQSKRCRKCWFKSKDRQEAITKKRNYTMTGDKHHSWKGGRVINTGGYVDLRIGNKYVLEHRYVMEQHLGRKLIGSEEVHHINHDKTDNSIENLMLFKNHAEHIAYEHSEGDRKR